MKMKTMMLIALAPAAGSSGFADVLSLRNGKIVQGTYQGGAPDFIKFQTADAEMTVNLDQVQSMTISPRNAPPTSPTPKSATGAAPVPATNVTVPAGTVLMVRTRDAVSSNDSPGKRFTAALETDLVVNGVVAAPAGTLVYGTVDKAQQAGRLAGKSEFSLSLTALNLGGTAQPIATSSFSESGSSSFRRAARGAAVGAAVGGIADGHDGAQTGAAIGAGAAVLRKGEAVEVPPGALLEFRLIQSATLVLNR